MRRMDLLPHSSGLSNCLHGFFKHGTWSIAHKWRRRFITWSTCEALCDHLFHLCACCKARQLLQPQFFQVPSGVCVQGVAAAEEALCSSTGNVYMLAARLQQQCVSVASQSWKISIASAHLHICGQASCTVQQGSFIDATL